jgi:hypothetical protein
LYQLKTTLHVIENTGQYRIAGWLGHSKSVSAPSQAGGFTRRFSLASLTWRFPVEELLF